MCAKLLQLSPTLCDPTDCSPPGSSIGFSRQEYWSGLPCPPPGDLPHPGIKPVSLTSPALAGRFFTTSATWEPYVFKIDTIDIILSMLSSKKSYLYCVF